MALTVWDDVVDLTTTRSDDFIDLRSVEDISSARTDRLCPACRSRHAINARRCRQCGMPLSVAELDPPLLRLEDPPLPTQRPVAAWFEVMGRRPMRSERSALERHPKFDHLLNYSVDALVDSGQRAFAEDHIDVDAWVAESLRSALRGPAREKVATLPEQHFAWPERESGRAIVQSKRRFVVGVIVLIALTSLLVLLSLNRQTSAPRSRAHAGQTASARVFGDQRSVDEIVAPVKAQYCAEGYDAVSVVITRTRTVAANGAIQPASVTTTIANC